MKPPFREWRLLHRIKLARRKGNQGAEIMRLEKLLRKGVRRAKEGQ